MATQPCRFGEFLGARLRLYGPSANHELALEIGFVSADLARVVREHGVGHTRIHPSTPEQNTFVERVFRALGEPPHLRLDRDVNRAAQSRAP